MVAESVIETKSEGIPIPSACRGSKFVEESRNPTSDCAAGWLGSNEVSPQAMPTKGKILLAGRREQSRRFVPRGGVCSSRPTGRARLYLGGAAAASQRLAQLLAVALMDSYRFTGVLRNVVYRWIIPNLIVPDITSAACWPAMVWTGSTMYGVS